MDEIPEDFLASWHLRIDDLREGFEPPPPDEPLVVVSPPPVGPVLRVIEPEHGGRLTPWVKGQSGNPRGNRPKVNRLQALFEEEMGDQGVAQQIWAEYLRLCLHARSEELRSNMLKDLLDRCGLARGQAGDRNTAVAQVINIIRGSPELGV